MSKHTPGPWNFEVGDAETRAMSEVFKAGDRTYRIALVNCEPKNPHVREEDVANARLITKAPELLIAVEDLLEMLDEWDSGFTKPGEEFAAVLDARHVLAAVRGEAVPQ